MNSYWEEQTWFEFLVFEPNEFASLIQLWVESRPALKGHKVFHQYRINLTSSFCLLCNVANPPKNVKYRVTGGFRDGFTEFKQPVSLYWWLPAVCFLIFMTPWSLFPYIHDSLQLFPYIDDSLQSVSLYSWLPAACFLIFMTPCGLFPYIHDSLQSVSLYSWLSAVCFRILMTPCSLFPYIQDSLHATCFLIFMTPCNYQLCQINK